MKTVCSFGKEGGFPSDQPSLAVEPALLLVSDKEQAHTFVRKLSHELQWTLQSALSYDEAVEHVSNINTNVRVVLYDADLRPNDWRVFLNTLQNLSRRFRLIVFSRTVQVSLWGE